MGPLSEANWVPQVSISHLGSLRFCLVLLCVPPRRLSEKTPVPKISQTKI